MNILEKQALFGALAKRYDVGFSQGIADQIESLSCRDIQFLDIKELNDLTAEYRTRIRCLIAACRATDEKTTVKQVYASHEKIFIRRQIADLWQLYRMTCADRREMTSAYLGQLGINHYPTSLPTGKKDRAAAC